MLNDSWQPPPGHERRAIKLFCIDVDAYYNLIEQGYWVGFVVPHPVRGGN